jgi:hypothetical protein
MHCRRIAVFSLATAMLLASANISAHAEDGASPASPTCPSGADEVTAREALAGVAPREAHYQGGKHGSNISVQISDKSICGKPFLVFAQVGRYRGRYQVFPPKFESLKSVIGGEIKYISPINIIRFSSGYLLLPLEAYFWHRGQFPRPALFSEDATWVPDTGDYGTYVQIKSVDNVTNTVILNQCSSIDCTYTQSKLIAIPPLEVNSPHPRIISSIRDPGWKYRNGAKIAEDYITADGRILMDAVMFNSVCNWIEKDELVRSRLDAGPYLFCGKIDYASR